MTVCTVGGRVGGWMSGWEDGRVDGYMEQEMGFLISKSQLQGT